MSALLLEQLRARGNAAPSASAGPGLRAQRNACQAANSSLNATIREVQDALLLPVPANELQRVPAEAVRRGGVKLSSSRALMIFAADAPYAWSTPVVRELGDLCAKAGCLERALDTLVFKPEELARCSEETRQATASANEEASAALRQANELREAIRALVMREAAAATAQGLRVGTRLRAPDADSLDTCPPPSEDASRGAAAGAGAGGGADADADAAAEVATAATANPGDAPPEEASAAPTSKRPPAADSAAVKVDGLPVLRASRRRGNRARGGTGGETAAPFRSPHASGGQSAGWPPQASAVSGGEGSALAVSGAGAVPSGGSTGMPGWLADLVRHVREVIAQQPTSARDPFKSFRDEAAGADSEGPRQGGRAAPAGLRSRPSPISGSALSSAEPSGAGGTAPPPTRGASTGGGSNLRAAAMRRAARVAVQNSARLAAAGTGAAAGAADAPEAGAVGVGGLEASADGTMGRARLETSGLRLQVRAGDGEASFDAAAAGAMPSPVVTVPAPDSASRHHAAASIDATDFLAVVHASWTGSAPRPSRDSIVTLTRMFGGSGAMACGGLADWLSRNRDIASAAGLVGVKVATGAAMRAVTPPAVRA